MVEGSVCTKFQVFIDLSGGRVQTYIQTNVRIKENSLRPSFLDFD